MLKDGWRAHIHPDPIVGDQPGGDGMILLPYDVMVLMGWCLGSHLRIEIIDGQLTIKRWRKREGEADYH